MCQREGVVDFAELLLRSYELLDAATTRCASTTSAASRTCWSTSSRTRTCCSTSGCALLAGPHDRGVRRRRRRPVDLRVPRRQRRQHAAFRARLRDRRAAGRADQARAELPLARAHPRRRQRAHPAQPVAARQEPVDRARARASRCACSRRRRDLDEAAFVVDVVQGLADEGVALDEIALLYRTNAQSRVLEHALFSAGMPYRVYGGMRFFERAEVKHALAYLRLIAEPGRRRRVAARGQLSAARHRRAHARAAAGRRARRAARALWQAACSGALGGKAGAALAAFVPADRASCARRRARCRCPRRSST